jgi:uncharacterized protein (TIGR02118 family)
MIKIVALLKRRPDLTLEEFSRYYEHQHAPLAARSIPPEVARAIKRYVQNHAIRLGGSRTDLPYDCVTEIGFDDVAGMQLWTTWYLGEGGRVLRDDEENFLDIGRRVVIVADERDIGMSAGPASARDD